MQGPWETSRPDVDTYWAQLSTLQLHPSSLSPDGPRASCHGAMGRDPDHLSMGIRGLKFTGVSQRSLLGRGDLDNPRQSHPSDVKGRLSPRSSRMCLRCEYQPQSRLLFQAPRKQDRSNPSISTKPILRPHQAWCCQASSHLDLWFGRMVWTLKTWALFPEFLNELKLPPSHCLMFLRAFQKTFPILRATQVTEQPRGNSTK